MKKIFITIMLATVVACCALNAQTNTFPPNGATGIGTTSINTMILSK